MFFSLQAGVAADLSLFCCFIPLVRLPQGCHGDAQLLRGERGSLAQQRTGGVPRVRTAVLRRGGLVPLLGHLKAGDVRRTRFFGPRHVCAFIFYFFFIISVTHTRAIRLTSCFFNYRKTTKGGASGRFSPPFR